jgi:hypothetical protein
MGEHVGVHAIVIDHTRWWQIDRFTPKTQIKLKDPSLDGIFCHKQNVSKVSTISFCEAKLPIPYLVSSSFTRR